MSRRLSQLLAEAKLADRDVAQAQARAGRDAQNFSSITQALQSLLPAAANLEQGYEKNVADEASRGAEQVVAENSGVGDKNLTPEQLAERLSSDKRIAGPEKTGNALQDFFADPFGARSRAAAAAQTAAEKGVIANTRAAREKAAATELETAQKNAQIDASKASTAASNQNVEASKATIARENADEARKAAGFTDTQTMEKAKRAALAGLNAGLSPGQIAVNNADIPDAVMRVALEEAKRDADKRALDAEKERAAINATNAGAARDYAAAKAAKDKPKGPQATSEEADKIGELKNSLDSISNVRSRMIETPTGIGTAISAFVGRQPLVGDLADPGAKARGLYDALEAFKAQELKRLSGSGVTAGERAAFDKFNASIRDNPTTAGAALDEYERAVRAAAQNKLSTMHELRGVDVSRVTMPAASAGDDLSFAAFQKAGG